MKPIAFVCHRPSAGPRIMKQILDDDGVESLVVPAWETAHE
jgi:hypothetical protein